MKKLNKILIITIITIFMIMTILSITDINKVNATNSTTSSNTQSTDKYNNDLASLSVDGYEISPVFNKNTVTYYVTIPEDVNSLEVNAKTESENATVKITGNTNLSKKENTINVVVASQAKTTKTYKIIATKQTDNGLKLSSLQIEGAILSPTFSSDNYYYETKITQDDKVQKLNITANANETSAKVEIIGNDDSLELGQNIITIILKDDENVTTYQVKAEISTSTIIVTSKGNLFSNIIATIQNFFSDKKKSIAFGVSLFVVILIIIISKARKSKKKDKNIE